MFEEVDLLWNLQSCLGMRPGVELIKARVPWLTQRFVFCKRDHQKLGSELVSMSCRSFTCTQQPFQNLFGFDCPYTYTLIYFSNECQECQRWVSESPPFPVFVKVVAAALRLHCCWD